MIQYCKETNPLDDLWREYEQMFSLAELPLSRQFISPELYNSELTLAMFGFGYDPIQRRKKEIAILQQELADIENAQEDALRSLPGNEETLAFFIPVMAESAGIT